MGQFKDLTGQKFGRWTVLYRTDDHIEPNGRPRVRYHCICDCGNEADVISGSLSKGHSRSCGCLQRDYALSQHNMRTHGHAGTRLHRVWKNMHTRCYNSKSKKYHRYGGRGIKICDEWCGVGGFERFEEWSLSNGYRDDLTIDRIDNDGDYTPSNCRWATIKEQCRNKSTNRFLEFNGVSLPICDWVERTGIRREKLYYSDDDKARRYIAELYNTHST